MKFLVIGANSFSGSHFVKRALQEGHAVVGMSRSYEPEPEFLPRKWESESKGRYTFLRINLNSGTDEFSSALKGIEPEIVVNFAAQGMVAESWKTPWDWFETNTVGLSKVLHGLQALSALKKYVHVSTPEVYGSTQGWVKESLDFSPSTPYAVSRAAGDWHVLNLVKSAGLPAVITRAANVFGPGQQLYRVIPRAFLSAHLGEKFPLHGAGDSTRSFIYIDDVVDATYRLCFLDTAGETFHISTESLVSIRDLVLEVGQVAGVDTEKLIEQIPERVGKDDSYQLNSTKIRERTGWSDSFSRIEGLEAVNSWVLSHLDRFSVLPRDYEHKA